MMRQTSLRQIGNIVMIQTLVRLTRLLLQVPISSSPSVSMVELSMRWPELLQYVLVSFKHQPRPRRSLWHNSTARYTRVCPFESTKSEPRIVCQDNEDKFVPKTLGGKKFTTRVKPLPCDGVHIVEMCKIKPQATSTKMSIVILSKKALLDTGRFCRPFDACFTIFIEMPSPLVHCSRPVEAVRVPSQ